MQHQAEQAGQTPGLPETAEPAHSPGQVQWAQWARGRIALAGGAHVISVGASPTPGSPPTSAHAEAERAHPHASEGSLLQLALAPTARSFAAAARSADAISGWQRPTRPLALRLAPSPPGFTALAQLRSDASCALLSPPASRPPFRWLPFAHLVPPCPSEPAGASVTDSELADHARDILPARHRSGLRARSDWKCRSGPRPKHTDVTPSWAAGGRGGITPRQSARRWRQPRRLGRRVARVRRARRVRRTWTPRSRIA
jgi:hypothetical protein